jgi:hypothetical protein
VRTRHHAHTPDETRARQPIAQAAAPGRGPSRAFPDRQTRFGDQLRSKTFFFPPSIAKLFLPNEKKATDERTNAFT